MADATKFWTTITTWVQQYDLVNQQLKDISERIGADSSLSAAVATAANNAGRKDVTQAEIDNLKAAIDATVTLLNDAGSNHGVNTATVKKAFYDIL